MCAAVDISSFSGSLLSELQRVQSVPNELLKTLQHGSNSAYLQTITELALDPRYTGIIYATHPEIFVEISSRWLLLPQTRRLAALSAYACILPFVPHLAGHVSTFLDSGRQGYLEAWFSSDVTCLHRIEIENLQAILLAFYRLLVAFNSRYAPYIDLAKLSGLLNHNTSVIRYLTIRIICLYLHASDAVLESMIKKHVGQGPVAGAWDGKTIDFSFLVLWEQSRLDAVKNKTVHYQQQENEALARTVHATSLTREIQPESFSNTTILVGNVLIPSIEPKRGQKASLVPTNTTRMNIESIAKGIISQSPLLVTGPPSSGKSRLIREIAKMTDHRSRMVTIHLNEQSDAKLLVGAYTNDTSSGSFDWRPGVLTQAVTEGRWLLIEDLDRAPPELMSVLLPLIERRELVIPNEEAPIPCSSDFKLIATVRTFKDAQGQDSRPRTIMLERREWYCAVLQGYPEKDLEEMVSFLFPVTRAHVPLLMRVFSALIHQAMTATSYMKSMGPRQLLRCCRRIEGLLCQGGLTLAAQPIPETLLDGIFLEAVDTFAGSLPNGTLRSNMVDLISQELHVPIQRVEHALRTRKPTYEMKGKTLRIGRATLHCRGKDGRSAASSKRFARTDCVLRALESLASTVQQAEPCLLVGETGTGKTSMIQHLAEASGQKLVVSNLSQQSEAGDLLGGYKPINPRSLVIPMKDDFEDLLRLTFPSQENHEFLASLRKAISRCQWTRALRLWEEALRTIESVIRSKQIATKEPTNELKSKRIKLQAVSTDLEKKWTNFKDDVDKLKTLLSGKAGGFAFSFVEGRIVQAVRNGDWVLLDEINLAPQDTLESLADLFIDRQDGGPSLLLSETGKIERIHAHENFRVFCAMNPATDVGKQDLPPSIRSRFTEIFINAFDNDISNLVAVAITYLSNHKHQELRTVTDVAQLYVDIKSLEHENRLVDGSGQKPHFSLRTFTRALTYAADVATLYGLRRALYEGFLMCFETILDQESVSLLQTSIDHHIFHSPETRKTYMNQKVRAPQDAKDYVNFDHHWILKGPSLVQNQPHYILTPFIRRNLRNLARAASTRRFPVLLQGPTSSGKTSMVEYLAKKSGNQCVRINNHEHTDLQEYLGTYVSDAEGNLVFQDGALVTALKEGHWIILDELNLAPTDVLEALNRLLDDNRELLVPETQQVIRPHDNFLLFATQNPAGMYGGRKAFSRAFRNRFLELHFDDIPEQELETILHERCQIAPSFCSKIVTVYKQLAVLRQSDRLFEQRYSFATLRDLFRWALRKADDREELARNGYMLLAERVRRESERIAVKDTIENVMKVKISLDHLYSSAALNAISGGAAENSHGLTWTKSMRRLMMLTFEAMRNKEPILLIGETGTGKTSVCQVLAELMGRDLHIVNAHQNMETGDLIGAYRPLQNRGILVKHLIDSIVDVLQHNGAYEKGYGRDIEALTVAYEKLARKLSAPISNSAKARINSYLARVKALFEWTDGSLLNAMKDGTHFLLDEISLADDAVLERLNSLLEPDRTLYVAEKGSTDVQVTASNNFQFLATMNPGGDHGKRELSGALRNRFTEIWVPTLTQEDEVIEIVEAKLHLEHKHLAIAMVRFSNWYSTTYNSTPHMSLRELISWAQFINQSDEANTSFAVYNGACMVFVDSLGAALTTSSSGDEARILLQQQLCIDKLQELFDLNLSAFRNSLPIMKDDEISLSIGDFRIAKRSLNRQMIPYNLQAPTTIHNAMKIARALQVNKPILLEGDPGVGKTTLVAALAQKVGIPLTRINLSDQTDLLDLFGSEVPIEGEAIGSFGWRQGPFLRAMQRGEWVLLDEMNLASQSVLEGLNACFDHRGEVFIPELGKTFLKHPNLAVFAAQNPYLQGSGRKGLPTSFLNRFTVVYMSNFDEADYEAICSGVYAEMAPELLRSVVKSVTDVVSRSQKDNAFRSLNGPWEINLRNAFRWLDILQTRETSMMPSHPFNYVQALFSHQFRTESDQAFIKDLISRSLQCSESVRTYYVNRNDRYLEVGQALLKRDGLSGSRQRMSGNFKNISLPVTESLMLCVDKRWPALLVGPSGSGKNSTILALANAVGAEVALCCANPEMDAQDFIGSFEQASSKRKLRSFMKNLAHYARQAMLHQLALDQKLDDDLIALQNGLSAKTAGPKLPVLLHDLASTYPESRFPSYLKNWENMTTSSQAQFEWVESSFVKALKQGKWLVLENSNLCNPSVLDRLNSLLEPNGSLIIHEHRNADGSAEVVRPHPAFRFFMTMDPRHGELSRAMRNRSVELFIGLSESARLLACSPLDPAIDASMSRFLIFQKFDWNLIDDRVVRPLLLALLDHFSLQDVPHLKQWSAQVIEGLVNIPQTVHEALHSAVEALTRLGTSDATILQAIENTYAGLSEVGAMPPGSNTLQASLLFACYMMHLLVTNCRQPIHPQNNPGLVSLTSTNPWSQNLSLLGEVFEVLLSLHDFDCRLASIASSALSKSPAYRNVPNKLLVSADTSGAIGDCVTGFLSQMTSFARACVNEASSTSEDNDEMCLETENHQPKIISIDHVLSYVRELVAFLEDMLPLVQSTHFDEAGMHVFLTLGKSLGLSQSSPYSSNPFIARLANELLSSLDTLFPGESLSSGLAMDQVWKSLKPLTTHNMDESSEIEAFADRFDSIKWTSEASLEEIVTLRKIFTDILGSSTVQAQSLKLPTAVVVALESLEKKSRVASTEMKPFFSHQFDALGQYQTCLTEDHQSLSTSLSVLSGERVKTSWDLQNCSFAGQILESVHKALHGHDPQNDLACLTQTLPLSLFSRLEGVKTVPMTSVNLLRQELQELGNNVPLLSDYLTVKSIGHIHAMLSDLHKSMYNAIWRDVQTDDKFRIEEAVKQLPCRVYGQREDTKYIPEHIAAIKWLRKCVRTVLSPAGSLGDMSTIPSSEQILHLSKEMVKYFTGYLLLYVPDQPYDPYKRSIIERDRHNRRKEVLKDQHTALVLLQKVISGQSESYRIAKVDSALRALGEAPTADDVFRPQISKMANLQGEFSNVLRLVVRSATLVESSVNDDNSRSGLEACRKDIQTTIGRLNRNFKDYVDIVRPLVALMNGLDAGFALALMKSKKPVNASSAIRQICSITPFMGCSLSGLLDNLVRGLQVDKPIAVNMYTDFIGLVAMIKQIEGGIPHKAKSHLLRSFHASYEEWKRTLDQRQREHVANSSLYRYRGDEPDNKSTEEGNIQELFANGENDPRVCEDSPSGAFDSSGLSQTMAHLQRSVFIPTRKTEQLVLAHLSNSSRRLARKWSDSALGARSPIALDELVSGLTIRLDEEIQMLEIRDGAAMSYNFYTDQNIAETDRLSSLISRTRSRFSDLYAHWPEHSTLSNVIQMCDEILGLRHTEPLIKLLSKAEQLHSLVSEWQGVASRDYSAAAQYEELTQLIISWRKLELTAWAKLLEIEDKRCQADAESWWFIAYETIIAAPLTLTESHGSLKGYAQQLLATLESFLASTSLGQYGHRIAILYQFQKHAVLVAEEQPSLRWTSSALTNFIGYYERFNPMIAQKIQAERQKLEKELRDILLLASWKDTNVVALRESSKRSHHKLFKVVRKYRELLAQPVESVLVKKVLETAQDIPKPPEEERNTDTPRVDSRAFSVCQQNLEGWVTTSPRFTDPSSTAQRMRLMTQVPSLGTNALLEFEDLGKNLMQNIEFLRKSTPTSLTSENSAGVRHLQTQKRKLFSETLKQLRGMGFQSNPSLKVLEEQSCLASVLATMSPYEESEHQEMQYVNYDLQSFLSYVIDIRSHGRIHHEDISHADISKSKGYLESILSTIIKQRATIATQASFLAKLKGLCHKMANLWRPDIYTLNVSDNEYDIRGLLKLTRWLPPILKAASTILESYSNLKASDEVIMQNTLEKWAVIIGQSSQNIEDLPKLPKGLTSSLHAQVEKEVLSNLDELRSWLDESLKAHPEKAFLLKQVRLWTEISNDTRTHQPNGVHASNVSSIQTQMFKVLDTMLVGSQNLAAKLATLPTSHEHPKWLVHTDMRLSEAAEQLKLEAIGQILSDSLSEMTHLTANNSRDVHTASAVYALGLPIVKQYCDTSETLLNHYKRLHASLCKLATFLAENLAKVCEDGFCNPAEPSSEDAGQSEKVESGTGLGEGEGGEDISKDVQDDEDLSELAQQQQEKQEDRPRDSNADAVNMDHDDLEGEMDEVSGGESLSEDSEADEEELDEQSGAVDELDPTAVDEKLWDGNESPEAREATTQGRSSQTSKNHQDRADSAKESQDRPQGEEETTEEVEAQDTEELDNMSQEDSHQVNTHSQDGTSLEMPEEMDIDMTLENASHSSLEDDDLDELSQTSGGVSEDSYQDEKIENEKDGLTETEEELDADEERQSTPKDDNQRDSKCEASPGDDIEKQNYDLDTTQGQPTSDVPINSESPSQAYGLDQDNSAVAEQGQEHDKSGTALSEDTENPQSKGGKTTGEIGATHQPQLEQSQKIHSGESSSLEERRNPLKQLGDALGEWHRSQTHIMDAQDFDHEDPSSSTEIDLADHDVEHLPTEDAQSDGQALGAANDDQARALDDQALASEVRTEYTTLTSDDLESEVDGLEAEKTVDAKDQREPITDRIGNARSTEVVHNITYDRHMAQDADVDRIECSEDMENLDRDLSTTHIEAVATSNALSTDDGRQLWTHYESATRDLSFYLTEQLRIILEPTKATKMRGDFRTGKRLNMKRIIPYIASQYKRDKIWMRRSIPSKRNYQIMLAVDDSKSMGQSASIDLAFQSLALISKSLTMLEAGQLCVVRFGNDVSVVHNFDRPLTSDVGATIINNFSFQQTVTNVRRLVDESISLFKDARQKTFDSSPNLWQLELIVSDGVCEDHDAIRRLCRRAQEEKIMIIFVIVDAVHSSKSIIDMTQAVFEPDASGESQLLIKRYLEDFPFPYYLIVNDVKGLPGALSQALRQWFAEVVGSG